MKTRVLDPSLQLIPTVIVKKKFTFFEHIHNFHLTDIFIIAIVAAVKLISEGEKFLRGRRPVSSESSPDGGLVVTEPPNHGT